MNQLLEAYIGLEYLVGNISANEKYYMCHTAVPDPASCNITKECHTSNTDWLRFCHLNSNVTAILIDLQTLKTRHLSQVSAY